MTSSQSPVRAGSPRKKLTRTLAPFLLLSPAVILVLVVLGYPMVRQFLMSFQKFGLEQQFGKPPTWVGLDNYIAILSDSYFWSVLAKSLAFCLGNAATCLFDCVAMVGRPELWFDQLPFGIDWPALQGIRVALGFVLDLLLSGLGNHHLGIHAPGDDLHLRSCHADR